MTEIIIIAAIAKNNTIGKDNDLPWRLTEDFQHFKNTTFGHPCIMGDKTYESIPENARPLYGRENIILTFKKDYKPEGTIVFNSFETAIEYCNKQNYSKAFITGGESIYKIGLTIANTLMITELQEDYEGDVFFPKFKKEDWEITNQTNHQGLDKKNNKEVKFSFITYKRN
ncbi:MAG: dihydrofolate reductase [Nanoarchaeota archaeon]|nr:dihydrofolate reductase [Nanoarchaeota archaeon]